MKNPYEVLGISDGSPPNVVNYAYRLLARRWHPDLHSGDDKKDKKEVEKRMKEINEAYDAIKKADINNQRWNYIDYEFRGPANDIEAELASIFSYSSVAKLDCHCAEIRKLERFKGKGKIGTGEKGPKYSFGVDGEKILIRDREEDREIIDDIKRIDGSEFDLEKELPWSVRGNIRSNFYLYLDMRSFEYGIIELEDLLIDIAKRNKSKIHPLYVRPTLRYYKIEDKIEPRIDEFCEMLSKPRVSPERIINYFKLNQIEKVDIKMFRYYLSRWIYRVNDFEFGMRGSYSAKETKEGGLTVSVYGEDNGERKFKLTRKDYTFIQYLVFGDKLLQQTNF